MLFKEIKRESNSKKCREFVPKVGGGRGNEGDGLKGLETLEIQTDRERERESNRERKKK